MAYFYTEADPSEPLIIALLGPERERIFNIFSTVVKHGCCGDLLHGANLLSSLLTVVIPQNVLVKMPQFPSLKNTLSMSAQALRDFNFTFFCSYPFFIFHE